MNETILQKIKLIGDILLTYGALLGYLIIVIDGLLFFGFSVDFGISINVDNSKLLSVLLFSGTFITIVFLVLCFITAPIGNLIYWFILTRSRYTLRKIMECINCKQSNMSWKQYKVIVFRGAKIKKSTFNVLFNKIDSKFSKSDVILALFVLTILYVVSAHVIPQDSLSNFIYAFLCLSLTIPSIQLSILSYSVYKERLFFLIVYLFCVVIFGLFMSSVGSYLFKFYLTLFGNLKTAPVLTVNAQCITDNLPMFNNAKKTSELSIIDKTSILMGPVPLLDSLKAKFFYESEINVYLESYSIVTTGPDITYLNLVDNKFIHIENNSKNITIDVSSCNVKQIGEMSDLK